jgi:hypothetical protein
MNRTLILLIVAIFAQQVNAQMPAKPGADYQVIAVDAAWCWFADPRAVYHKGKYEKSYFGYINSKGDVVISARDEKTKVVQNFVLHHKLQVDDHNVPSILFLPDGKLLAFYTHHNGTFFMRKSKNPEDITSWEEEQTFDFGMEKRRICYSHPAMLSGEDNRIYMVFRSSPLKPKSWREYGQYMSYSDDFGKTWSKAKCLLDVTGIDNPMYLKLSTDNKSRIDILFTDGHPKIGAASVYHMYYEKGVLHQTDGGKIGEMQDLPLKLDKINKVYDVAKTGTKAWIWDIALDRKRRPVVAYSQYPSVNDHIYHYARWDGKKWIDYELLNSGGYITSPEKSGKVLEEHYSGGVVLDHEQPENVYLSREVNQVFEIEHWKLKGNAWKKDKITENSKQDNLRPYVLAHYPGNKPPVFWMTGVYEHYIRFKTDLRANK